MRGIPRIVKSRKKSTFLFVAWLVGVLTCAGILIWQLAVLFMRYASYPVNTLFLPSADWQYPTFPDITVCNICPLVNENSASLRYTDYVQILNKNLTYEAVQAHLGTNYQLSQDTYNYIFGDLVAPAAYFNNFPITNSLTNTFNSVPVLTCGYFNWDYSPNGVYNCTPSIQVKYDPDYYKCYTMRLNNSERQNVRGFSAIIYTNDFQESELTNFNLDIRNSRATGLRVAVHAAGTEPDMKLGMSVAPGMETTMTVSQIKRTRLPAPYSNCTQDRTYNSSDITYTGEYCVDVCLQGQFLAQCKCILSTLQFTDQQLSEAQSTICGNLSITSNTSTINWDGLEKVVCAATFNPDEGACMQQCYTPCLAYKYSASISAAPWPHLSSQLSFYQTYIKDNPRFVNISQFNDYQVVQEYIANYTDTSILLQKLDSAGIIKNNFLQVNIQFDTRSFDVHQDMAAFTYDALGSQVGGVLNLWLGVTILLLFEICEFVYTIISTMIQVRRIPDTEPNLYADAKYVHFILTVMI